MGCSSSLASPPGPGNNTADDQQFFTDEQKRVIRKTWKHLANDLTGHGTNVFLHIFALRPDVKQLFPALRDVEGQQLVKNANFKGHASRFMQAVGAVVDNLDDPEGALAPLLIGLGKQHIHFVGFEVDYFDIFTQAMMHVWARELGGKFSGEVAHTWEKVFQFIMQKLREGYNIARVEEEKRVHFAQNDGGGDGFI